LQVGEHEEKMDRITADSLALMATSLQTRADLALVLQVRAVQRHKK
jgi:hypothetical protein